MGEKGEKQQGLRQRFLLLFLLFTLLPALLVGGTSTYLSVQGQKESDFSSNQLVAIRLASEIGNFVEQSRGLTEALAGIPAVQQLDAAATKAAILAAQKANPQFELIYVMNDQGDQIARTSGALANRAEKEYFKKAFAGQVFVSDTYISAFTKASTVTISVPIRDAGGKTVGVMAADISLKSLAEIAARTKIGKTGYVDVVDKSGALVAHPNAERVAKQDKVTEYGYVKEVLAGKLALQEAKSTTGVDSLIAVAPVEKYGWGVVAYLPADELQQQVLRSIGLMAGLVLLVLAGAVFAAMRLAKSLADPLARLALEADCVAQGDLTRTIEADGAGEVRMLGVALQNMHQRFRTMVQDIVGAAEHVAAASEELTATAEQSALAAKQVADSITGVAEGADSQLRSVRQTVTVVEATAVRIETIATGARQAADVSRQTAGLAREGDRQVETAISQMAQIERTVSHSADTVARLGERSQAIGQIVETIAGIAGQTNLLALNAAIEAARAGEQGRGFAVVAEEVRKLAEQSEQAAREIAALISEVRTETDQAVTAMQQGAHEVRTGSQVVTAAGESFRAIVEAVDKVAGEVAQMAQDARQMQDDSAKIVQAVREIDSVSQATAAQAETVSAATEEQAAAMAEITQFSQSLAKMAENLQSVVRRFTV